MQIDLHHAGMYVLCRLAGMSSEYAEIVAYSSQYVDDAVCGHALTFNNGEVFKQIQTAYKIESSRQVDADKSLDIWMPFHFIPKGDKEGSEALVTAPNSKVLELLLEDICCTSPEYILYRLGIGLHCFADAFSHQDFNGFYDPHNDVRLVYGMEEKDSRSSSQKLSFKLLDRWSTGGLAIGHSKVLDNPDIPYADWGYNRRGEVFKVCNLEERYLPGLNNIYDYLIYFLAKNPQFSKQHTVKPFEEYLDNFRELLSFRGTKEERHEKWLKQIRKNYFDFIDFDKTDRALIYNEKQWFDQAIETTKVSRVHNLHNHNNNEHIFRKKDGFAQSHWVRFMQAAFEHQFLIIHCFLPELGIIVG